MEELEFYQGQHTGEEIDEAVDTVQLGLKTVNGNNLHGSGNIYVGSEGAQQAADEAAASAAAAKAAAASIDPDALNARIFAAFPHDMSSSAAASFTDGADGIPAQSLVAKINPIQSAGTPTPSNPLTIDGWTGATIRHHGKNVFGVSIASGGIGSNGDNTTNNKRCRTGFVPLVPGQAYTASVNSGIVIIAAHYYRRASTGTGSHYSSYNTFSSDTVTFVTPAANSGQNIVYVKLVFRKVSDTAISPSDIQTCQIEPGGVATDYVQFIDSDVSIDWQSSAGTVYAGTMEIDQSGAVTLRSRPYYASYNGETLVGPWVSSMDVYAPGTTPTTGAQVVDLGGAETTYQLSIDPILTMLGDNNIWADTGDIEVEYRADPTLYIERINAPADEDMIANNQIPAGKYFVINNTLYYSTTTIPAGDAITPGSNCTQTNLADALNALAQ